MTAGPAHIMHPLSYLTRHSLAVLARPQRYLVDMDTNIDIPHWLVTDYRWEPDPLGGWLDHAQHPADTLASDRGDCVDVAILVGSWLASRGDSVYLGLSVRANPRAPAHMVVSDGDRIYEGTGRHDPNGQIHDSLTDYLADSPYSNVTFRRVV